MITKAVLLEQAQVLLAQINYQIWVMEKEAERENTRAVDMRLPSGEWALSSLLAAKAQTIASIIALREH